MPNPNGELKPGIYCTVELKLPRRTPSLIVPAAAIVFDHDGLRAPTVRLLTMRPRLRPPGPHYQ